MAEEIMIRIDHVSKEYRLGAIGGTTLREDLQRFNAKLMHKEDPTLKIGQSSAHFGEKFMALDDVSFEVKKGEAVGIIGHNGAGKSTLLKLLSRVTAPSQGTIYLNGRIASMLEVGTGFHPELTGRENIYMNGAILGMTKAEIDSKIEQIIDFSECRDFIDTPVKRYSSGMYVKLAFSVAAHLDSEIMVMDEVLAVGDMKFQKKCLGRMGDAANSEGRTILYVSHNMSTIRQLCTRCIVLNHGHLIFDGDVEKAIEIYEEANRNADIEADYSEAKRPKYLKTDSYRLQFARFAGKENNTFSRGEKMQIEFTLKQNKKLTDSLGLRFEIRSLTDVAIATSLIADIPLDTTKEEHKFTLEYDLGDIVAGEYKCFYTFYISNELGGTLDIDCMPGLMFTIKTSEADTLMQWRPSFWGYVRLKDPELISIE